MHKAAKIASTAASCAALVLGTALPAFAQTSSRAQAARPLGACGTGAGTVLSATATSAATAWLPTSVSSSFVAGPGTITRTVSADSTVGATVSASFEVDESLLFASAKETYGVAVSGSLSHSASWSYSINIPSSVTAKVQQYHEGDEIGIKQTYETGGTVCGTATETSSSGNYFPWSSSADDTYCYAGTTSQKPGIQVRSTCTNTD